MEVVDSLPRYDSLLNVMIESYQNQDVDQLMQLIKETMTSDDDPFYEEWDRKMMSERNHVQLEGIIRSIKQQSTFVAVGTAHLFGDQGLIKLLRQKGYKVQPVY